MTDVNYVVAGSRPWSREVFQQVIRRYPGRWHLVTRAEQLTWSRIKRLSPRYLFVLHWSWKVPQPIVEQYECVGFHMTDLPYGRGGSPLQHLILRGHRRTHLTAFQLGPAFDAGPVYLKQPVSLDGSAQDIYERISHVAARMVRRIIQHRLIPVPQRGRAVVFRRRRPQESRIPRLTTAARLHDFIRMLDAEGYPRAFLDHEGFRYEFSRASQSNGRLVARVRITPVERG